MVEVPYFGSKGHKSAENDLELLVRFNSFSVRKFKDLINSEIIAQGASIGA